MTINKVFLTGRLGKDPQIRQTSNNNSMLVLRLATNFADKTEWFTAFAFGKVAEFIAKFAKKGQELFIEGRISAKSYKDSSGNDKESMVIVVSSVELGKIPLKVQSLNSFDKDLSSNCSMFEPNN